MTDDGQVSPGWERAGRLAIAEVIAAKITDWQEIDVGWDNLHDQGTEGAHHARVARFLRDRQVEAVVASHMGSPMRNGLQKMGLQIRLGAAGDARAAVRAARP